MGVLLSREAVLTDFAAADISTPAAATPAVVTLAALPGRAHIIDFVQVSYSAAPTGGNLLIQVGATTVYSLDVTVAGPVHIPVFRRAAYDAAVTVTLASGGAGVSGKLAVSHRTEGA